MSLFSRAATATPSLTMCDLLQIEDTPELMEFRCVSTAVPIWPQVRIAFFRMIIADHFFTSAESTDVPQSGSRVRALSTLARATVHNLSLHFGERMHSDILINTEAIGDQYENGKYYNRYVDPFGDYSGGQAVVLTDMFEWGWNRPRHNERIYFHAPLQAGQSLRSRLPVSKAARHQAEALTDFVCGRARALIGWQIDGRRRAAFIARVAGRISTHSARYGAYAKLLRRVRPKLLLGSSHCYGFHAPLIAAARDMGVVTAEYQHGAVSDGHDAYNFAPSVAESGAYQRTLPDYFLSYGDWWNEHIDIPVEKISIGYPARTMKLAKMEANPAERKEVLFLTDGVEFELYLDVAIAVEKSVRAEGYKVVLRPHPMERTAVLAKWKGRTGRVVIDEKPDIYAAFYAANTVVSEVSTGLFEAIGLVENVLMLDTLKARFALPSHPFAMAPSVESIIDIVLGRASGAATEPAEHFWKDDWQSRYKQFLQDKVGLK